MTLVAVVLAGGPPDAVSALQPGARNKAFVSIAGKSLVARTMEALRASGRVSRIIAVAPVAMHGSAQLAAADELRPDGTRITESLARGLAGLPPDQSVLISASDLPILSSACIDAFVRDALAADADVTYAILERTRHERQFPHVPHTWARMRDGTFCGGGFVTLRPRVYPLLDRFLERLGAARKNPLRLASLFGWDVLARFAARRLTVAQAEARASKILGASVRAIRSDYPEMAVNVDRPGDVALAEALIAARANSTV